MRSIDAYGEMLKEIDSFVSGLDPSVRAEAFRFLLEEEQKQMPKGVRVLSTAVPPKSDRTLSPKSGCASVVFQAQWIRP